MELAGSTDNFFWLSSERPIVSGTPFLPDLQSWIRNANLDPDWSRIGADIVGGNPAPTFNGSFSLTGTVQAMFDVDRNAGVVNAFVSLAD